MDKHEIKVDVMESCKKIHVRVVAQKLTRFRFRLWLLKYMMRLCQIVCPFHLENVAREK
jgi:hypothetical protein